MRRSIVRCVGNGVGRKLLLGENSQVFLAKMLVWCNHANNGKSPADTIDLIQDIDPKLNWKQASQTFL
jgi:hypothetical protein